MYAVDSGDSIAVAQCIAKNNLAGKTLGSGWDVGTQVLQGVSKAARLHDRPAGLPAGLRTDGPAVPVQHLGRSDEAVRHRHRPRLRDEDERRSVPQAQDPVRRKHPEGDGLQASGDDLADLIGAAIRHLTRALIPAPRYAERGRLRSVSDVVFQRPEMTIFIVCRRAHRLLLDPKFGLLLVHQRRHDGAVHRADRGDRRWRSVAARPRRDRPLRGAGLSHRAVVRRAPRATRRAARLGHRRLIARSVSPSAPSTGSSSSGFRSRPSWRRSALNYVLAGFVLIASNDIQADMVGTTGRFGQVFGISNWSEGLWGLGIVLFIWALAQRDSLRAPHDSDGRQRARFCRGRSPCAEREGLVLHHHRHHLPASSASLTRSGSGALTLRHPG